MDLWISNEVLKFWYNVFVWLLNSLTNGATYKEEEGVQSLYLNGSGAYATTPAVNFGRKSFTITSWVKLQSPVNRPSPIYTDWSQSPPAIQFLVSAYGTGENWLFGGFNNIEEFKPWIEIAG